MEACDRRTQQSATTRLLGRLPTARLPCRLCVTIVNLPRGAKPLRPDPSATRRRPPAGYRGGRKSRFTPSVHAHDPSAPQQLGEWRSKVVPAVLLHSGRFLQSAVITFFEEKAKANIIDRIYYIWQKGERLVRTRFRARPPGGATFTP